VDLLPRGYSFAFRESLRVIAASEGGDVNHPADPGMATRWGVTERTLNRWLQNQRRPLRPISTMTAEEAGRIYFENFWVAGFCDRLPFPASLAHFDAMVQHGPGARSMSGQRGANHILQASLGVVEDGIVGPRTLAAAQAMDPAELAHRLLFRRALHYWALSLSRPDLWTHFGRGWRNRMDHLHSAVMNFLASPSS
jgi:lysozyme family protein